MEPAKDNEWERQRMRDLFLASSLRSKEGQVTVRGRCVFSYSHWRSSVLSHPPRTRSPQFLLFRINKSHFYSFLLHLFWDNCFGESEELPLHSQLELCKLFGWKWWTEFSQVWALGEAFKANNMPNTCPSSERSIYELSQQEHPYQSPPKTAVIP